jgi:hypothetical protein
MRRTAAGAAVRGSVGAAFRSGFGAAARATTGAALLAALAASATAQTLPDRAGGTAGAVQPPLPAGAVQPRLPAALPIEGLVAAQSGRQTRRFARYGAIAGGLGGLAVGTWMALYCAGTSSDGGCVRAVPLLGAFGAVSGGAAGAIIGAAVPVPGHAGTIASGGAAAGVAHASIGDERGAVFTGAGTAARLYVHAELRPWLALGPEVGIASFGGGGDIRHIAVATRFTAAGRRVAPFATVHLGAYDSTAPSLEYFGGGFGLGARVRPGLSERLFVDVEARYSRNLQHIEPMRMRGLSVSGGLYW